MKQDSIYKYNALVTTAKISKPWSIAVRKNNLFLYWKDERTPRFKFTKSKQHSMWRNESGVEMRSIKLVIEWAVQQPYKRP